MTFHHAGRLLSTATAGIWCADGQVDLQMGKWWSSVKFSLGSWLVPQPTRVNTGHNDDGGSIQRLLTNNLPFYGVKHREILSAPTGTNRHEGGIVTFPSSKSPTVTPAQRPGGEANRTTCEGPALRFRLAAYLIPRWIRTTSTRTDLGSGIVREKTPLISR